MSVSDLLAYGFMLLFLLAVAIPAVLGVRSNRRDQQRLDAEYNEERTLHDRASQWPADGCRWCGSTDTPLDHIRRCAYCAELQRLTGPAGNPRFAPFKMTMIRG